MSRPNAYLRVGREGEPELMRTYEISAHRRPEEEPRWVGILPAATGRNTSSGWEGGWVQSRKDVHLR
jgi:hypothetical protein